VGPLLFEETINTEWYQIHLTKLISLLEENEKDCWFQHDGATANTADTTTLVQEFSGECMVGSGVRPQ
jgi:hypothetical protein